MGPPRGPIDLRVDVSAAVDLDGVGDVAAWVFAPSQPAAVPTVIFCEHGGSGVTKDYWHLEVDGHPGYSLAEWFASRGCIVVATDDVGVGGSSRPDDSWQLTSLHVAQANRAVHDEVIAQLAAGTLAGLPAITDPVTIGLSHGRGGLMRIREQARFRTYAAVAIMGFPNQQPQLPPDWWGAALTPVLAELTAGKTGLEAEVALTGLRDLAGVEIPKSTANRSAMNALYFFDDVPEAVIAADIAAGTAQEPGPVTIAGMVIGGVAADDAAQIDVPVFCGWGQQDCSIDPYREPSFYRSSPDITFQLLPRSGHCENFASTRELHWRRLALWLRDVWALR